MINQIEMKKLHFLFHIYKDYEIYNFIYTLTFDNNTFLFIYVNK